MTVRSSLKMVSEVVAKLTDRGFCESHVTLVNKGSDTNPRWLPAVTWIEVCGMLDDVFGPFGWDAVPVGSTSDYTNGLYTYDLMLVGRALDDVTGEVVELKRPGRGLGLVPRSAIASDAEHDRQAHGAKSDAITNASKALGDGFGRYLYIKEEAEAVKAELLAQRGEQPAPKGRTSAPRPNNGGAGGNKDQKVGEATGPQAYRMRENGWTNEQIAALSRDEVRAVMDGIFGKDGAPKIAPHGPTGAPTNQLGDDFPMPA